MNKLAGEWKSFLIQQQSHKAINNLRRATSLEQVCPPSDRPPAEPPPDLVDTVMTDTNYPDTSGDDSSTIIPSLDYRSDSSSDSSFSRYDRPYPPSYDDDDSSISSTSSLAFLDEEDWPENLGPPPPGSLMSYWNKPLDPTEFSDFDYFKPPQQTVLDDSVAPPTAATASITTDSSLSDGGSVCSWDSQASIAFNGVTVIDATARILTGGELVDSGANFSMCNNLSCLVNVVPIQPFTINMAAIEGNSTSKCTHRGDFPLPMVDGSVFYTPMYFNSSASDCLLSPEAVCQSSKGIFTRWTQEGDPAGNTGAIRFFHPDGSVGISLSLQRKHGLYFTSNKTLAVSSFSSNRSVTPIDGPIDTPPTMPTPTPLPPPPKTAPFSVPTPKTVHPTGLTHRQRQQIEFDLWQARLGHCSEWQLQVLPQMADGTPDKFAAHPFASYDAYNQARIRKMPPLKGRHPSRATDKSQRFFMDFGFMRASTSDYSRPDPKRDRVVTSFDGFNSYFLIVDEFTKYIWVFLCKSKEPPIEVAEHFLKVNGSSAGGVIRCDLGGELAKCNDFVTRMCKAGYDVEPTGADSPDQNKGAEKWNDTLGVTVRVLLYGAGLTAEYWSAALQHAAFLHNRRVHRSTMMTPFQGWFGFKPDLQNLRVFGSRVCVKRTGKRRSKLDRHAFTGIFLGYTATDANIRYIDVNTKIVKRSHHAIFDEAWYLQPHRPPFAQMLYDIGLEEPSESPVSSPNLPPVYPPSKCASPPPLPVRAKQLPLPLRLTSPPEHASPVSARAAHSKVGKSLDHEIISQHEISNKDLQMVYLSPHAFKNSFEEVLDLRKYTSSMSPTAGLLCKESNGRLYFRDAEPSTPAAKIRAWRSRLRGAWLIQVNDTPVSTMTDLRSVMSSLLDSKSKHCTLLMAHSELKDGLVETGIPQVNIDQMHRRYDFQDTFAMTQEEFDDWFARLPRSFYDVVDEGGVHNCVTSAHKLTRRLLLEQDDWPEWQESEFLQLDQYEKQNMFGTPCPIKDSAAVFHLIWTYVEKVLDKRKKARCTCDGSNRGGQVRVLDHTYANSIDQTSSRIFYAIAAVENLLVFGSDVSNAFGEAPAPKQGFYIYPDKAFRAWWASKGRPPIPKGWVVPVLAAMQGHPESPRLWEKHIDKILRSLGFVPTVHEPCLYSGFADGLRVIFKRQVDDFGVAAPNKRCADLIFDALDDNLQIPIKRQGLITLYNGIDVQQSRWFIKLSVQTYLTKTLTPYLNDWLDAPTVKHPTPLGTNEAFLKRLYLAQGDPDPNVQAALKKKMKFGFRNAMGELIWPMVTCRPDFSQAVVKCAQGSAFPSETHYLALKSVLRYAAATMDEGIYFWRTKPCMDLPDDPLPTVVSTPHDIRLANRPKDIPNVPHTYMDSSWGDCLLTRRSFGGWLIRMAGGPIAYKSQLWPTVAQSSTESEFMLASAAGRATLYVRSILWDLDVPQFAATFMYEDNDGATAMANAGKPTSRSRHIDIKYYAIQEWVERDLIVLSRIDTSVNMSDHFTKPLPRILFYRHRDFYMGHVPPTYSPKYVDFSRAYAYVDDSAPNTIVARAATTSGPWDIVWDSLPF